MNKLELTNQLRLECSVAGNGLATTVNQEGESARLVAWIENSYQDIQNEFFDWRFLKRSSTFTTQLNTNIIQPPADLNIWDIERFYTSSGDKVEVREYADLEYQLSVNDKGVPSEFYVLNDNTLQTYPYPDGLYTYTFDYFAVPDEMTSDTAIPIFPKQFHRLIVARGMIYYGNYESAVEIKQQGAEVYQNMMRQLKSHQTARQQQFYGRADAGDIQIIPE